MITTQGHRKTKLIDTKQGLKFILKRECNFLWRVSASYPNFSINAFKKNSACSDLTPPVAVFLSKLEANQKEKQRRMGDRYKRFIMIDSKFFSFRNYILS